MIIGKVLSVMFWLSEFIYSYEICIYGISYL